MKKLVFLLVLVVAMGFISCDDDDDKFWLNKKANIPEDVVSDETNTEEFNYQTVTVVTFDLKIVDESGNPVGQAIVRLVGGEGDINTSISDSNGSVNFKGNINKTDESVKLVIEHSDYIEKIIIIENIHDLSSVIRTIYLESKEVKEEVVDTDKDGVPDDLDGFPEDPTLIGSVSGEFTIAYEDMWPQMGDADFNDMVVRLNIEEFIDPDNMISKIVIKTKLLAAGAGYKNQFWINVLGKDYQVIFNPKQLLKGQWNTREKDEYKEALPIDPLVIIPESPVPRDSMEPMPYDPYIRCNGNNEQQVHLSFVKTKWGGKVLGDSDELKNFPWAVMVPSDWAWPLEGSNIFEAYPEFDDWYKSGGTEHKDWYLHPEVSKVFKVSLGTALTAYLLKVSPGVQTGIIVGILITMLLVLFGINVWRKKTHKSLGA